jgi:hypothetical protein
VHALGHLVAAAVLGGRVGAAGDHAAAKRDDAIHEVASRSDITNGALD